MDLTKQISFHEATVIAFCLIDATVILKLEDVLADNVKSNVTLKVVQVKSIRVDGKKEEIVSMEAEDGEVLSLDYTNDKLSVIVEWHNFDIGTTITKSYVIYGDKVSLLLG